MPKTAKSQGKKLDLNRQIKAIDIKIFSKTIDLLLIKVSLLLKLISSFFIKKKEYMDQEKDYKMLIHL